jgi:hypothetical protein
MKARYDAKHRPVQYKLFNMNWVIGFSSNFSLTANLASLQNGALNFHPVTMVLFPILAEVGFMA